MTKQEAQDEWDAIVTVPGLDRAGAERILAEQRWFSYTPAGEQMFSSGGSSGVRGVYVWDWQLFVSLACLAWRMQVREPRRQPAAGRRRGSRCSRPASRRTRARRCSMSPTGAGMDTVVIAAGAPFDEVLARGRRRPSRPISSATRRWSGASRERASRAGSRSAGPREHELRAAHR